MKGAVACQMAQLLHAMLRHAPESRAPAGLSGWRPARARAPDVVRRSCARRGYQDDDYPGTGRSCDLEGWQLADAQSQDPATRKGGGFGGNIWGGLRSWRFGSFRPRRTEQASREVAPSSAAAALSRPPTHGAPPRFRHPPGPRREHLAMPDGRRHAIGRMTKIIPKLLHHAELGGTAHPAQWQSRRGAHGPKLPGQSSLCKAAHRSFKPL